MDAVTYPNDKVIDFINKKVISLRIPSDNKPLAADFGVEWTPTLMILDHKGKEQYRTVGFFSAEDLVPSLLLGIGNAYFNANLFKEALDCYGEIINQYSQSDSVQEAIFQKGVSLYKSTNDPIPLKDAYEQLNEKYSESPWAKRAYPYRLIG